jgi:hypothetical protein
MKKATPIEKIAMKELESILQRARVSPLDEKGSSGPVPRRPAM